MLLLVQLQAVQLLANVDQGVMRQHLRMEVSFTRSDCEIYTIYIHSSVDCSFLWNESNLGDLRSCCK